MNRAPGLDRIGKVDEEVERREIRAFVRMRVELGFALGPPLVQLDDLRWPRGGGWCRIPARRRRENDHETGKDTRSWKCHAGSKRLRCDFRTTGREANDELLPGRFRNHYQVTRPPSWTSRPSTNPCTTDDPTGAFHDGPYVLFAYSTALLLSTL